MLRIGSAHSGWRAFGCEGRCRDFLYHGKQRTLPSLGPNVVQRTQQGTIKPPDNTNGLLKTILIQFCRLDRGFPAVAFFLKKGGNAVGSSADGL